MSEKINANPAVFAPTKTTTRKGAKTSRYLWSDEGEFEGSLSLIGGDYPLVSSSKSEDDMDLDEEEDEPIDAAEIFGKRIDGFALAYLMKVYWYRFSTVDQRS
jgi:hypothetical protein